MDFNNRKNQNLLRAIKKMHTLVESTDVEKQRASQENLSGIFSKSKELIYQDIKIGNIPAEWVSVDRVHMDKYAILYCHGGGYNTGSFRYARSITNKLAASTAMDVLSFDYRLAPEHPYPAALEDALEAWDYLMRYGYGAREVILAGDSAGGNLALALTAKLKSQGRRLPRGLILFSPWTDLSKSGKSHEIKADTDPILSAEYLDKAILDYAGEKDKGDPFISPLFADFKGFPPTFIQVGENEILLSDSYNLRKNMLKQKVQVKFEFYSGMWHVFQMSPFKTAYEAMDHVAEFIFEICR